MKCDEILNCLLNDLLGIFTDDILKIYFFPLYLYLKFTYQKQTFILACMTSNTLLVTCSKIDAS